MKNPAQKIALLIIIFFSGCNFRQYPTPVESTLLSTPEPASTTQATLQPTRPAYKPAELVDYTAQSGDTLPALASRFNTSIAEILQANPGIPREATTMPPGMPMKIPIYFRALWANPYQIIPDHAFINGPSLIGFNTSAFVADSPGWLKEYTTYASGEWRNGAEIVDLIAANYSISPKLLLAILEYQGGALTQPQPPIKKKLLGFQRPYYDTPYLQLVIAANTLNNGYYGWRTGSMIEFELTDQTIVRPDPWQNAGSVAIQYYFSTIRAGTLYANDTGPNGLYATYIKLFGDPWQDQTILMPGSLQQPEFKLPFSRGYIWSYTGGPHTGWGSGEPFSSIDFAPPSNGSGCFVPDKNLYVTAMADGLVVRSGINGLVQDLDNDGDERTGWAIFYLHLAAKGRVPAGEQLSAGDYIGYPSCEGGRVTGTHVHIGRKYNGEWVSADGSLPFTMDGWITRNGEEVYQGTLEKGNHIVTACECSNYLSQIQVGIK